MKKGCYKARLTAFCNTPNCCAFMHSANDIEVESQINLATEIADMAVQFETEHEGRDWNETGDYPEAIDAFAEKWLTKEYGLEVYRSVSGGNPEESLCVGTVRNRIPDLG